MNELEKVTERIGVRERACRQLSRETSSDLERICFSSQAEAYSMVIKILKDFMSRQTVVIVDTEKASAAIAEGIQKLATDLEGKGDN